MKLSTLASVAVVSSGLIISAVAQQSDTATPGPAVTASPTKERGEQHEGKREEAREKRTEPKHSDAREERHEGKQEAREDKHEGKQEAREKRHEGTRDEKGESKRTEVKEHKKGEEANPSVTPTPKSN